MDKMRRYLVAGVLVWVPLVVTFFVIRFVVGLMDQTLLLLPERVRPEQLFGFPLPGIGVLLTALLLLATGMVFANFVGQRLWAWGEELLYRVPFVRAVYGSAKQFTETLFSSKGKSFRKVVLIEYPRRETWTLGFLTGEGLPAVEGILNRQLAHVFVPTTPNPTSGFFLILPREQVIETDLPVDVGLKLIVSAGVVTPENADLERRRIRATVRAEG